MRRFFILILISLNYLSYSQITIDKTDMPAPGKYYNLSTNITVLGNDFTKTGNDFTWDFSSLFPINQVTDSFNNVNTVPIVFRVVFNNVFDSKHKATVVQIQKTVNIFPGLDLSDVYSFYKLDDNSYSQVGFGGSINSLPIPVKFDNPDIIYKMPLKSGNIDSCIASFNLSLSGIGYLGQVKHRKNTVDGWGTLITPYGTFQSLRIKSEITEKDTAYLDTLGITFPALVRNYTEYKWLVKGYNDPMLQITQEGIALNVRYIDSIRTASISKNLPKSYIKIYPNPVSDKLNIKYNVIRASNVEITLKNILGDEIKNIDYCYNSEGVYFKSYDLNKYQIKPGIYLLNIKTNRYNIVEKVVIY